MSSVIERRASVLADADDETVALVEMVVREIAGLEKRNRKRWHKDLRTWSAVAEMFANGPVTEVKHHNEVDDEQQSEAWEPLSKIYDRQRELVRSLSELGVSVAPERRLIGPLAQGLLGSRQPTDSRVTERSAIDSIADEELRAAAIELHDQLVALDAEHESARAAWAEIMQPYRDAEKAGRQDYRDYLHEEAVRKRERGEPFNILHHEKAFYPWR